MTSHNKDHKLYVHCPTCLAERPLNISAKSYARLSVEVSKTELTVRCIRHDIKLYSWEGDFVDDEMECEQCKKESR